MRSFIISLSVLLAVVAAASINSVCAVRLCDRLELLTEALPEALDDPDAADSFDTLDTEWKKCSAFLGLSVRYDYICVAESAVLSARGYYFSGDAANYRVSHTLILDSIRRIREFEEFSPGNVF